MTTQISEPIAPHADAAPRCMPTPTVMAKRRHLSVVPDLPAAVSYTKTLERVEPKQQIKLHPKGCRCNYHNPNGPWMIPQKPKDHAILSAAGPKVVLWDVENWQGTPVTSPLNVAREFQFCRTALGLTRDDYIVFGMSHFTAMRCSFALPTNQAALVLGSGPDGADKALMLAADLPRLAASYRTLVVVSNDHIFSDVAVQAKALGMITWNVSTDQAFLSPETRAAYDGWTHIKLQAVREHEKAEAKAKKHLRAVTEKTK